MNFLLIIRGIVGVLALLSAGLFITDFVSKDISLNLLIMFVVATIGLFGIDEIKQHRKATGYLMMGIGVVFFFYYLYRLIILF